MEQYGTVIGLGKNSTAKVSVERRSACGHSCGECRLCDAKSIEITAKNRVNASVGDRVRIYTDTKKVRGAVVLVYLMPVAAFFAAYAAASGIFRADDTVSAVSAVAAFALSAAVIFFTGRKCSFEYEITRVEHDK